MRQIQALREQGRGLDEIAAHFGVSRERVRQILLAHGGPDPKAVAEARRRRAEQLAVGRIDELLALWRAGEDPASVAVSLGLRAAACRVAIERFATDVDRAARRVSAGARSTPTYSDDDIVAALRSVTARLGRTPSAKVYGTIAREEQLPSLPTILNRMGGWSRAIATAGLGSGAAPAGRRPRRWTSEACWEALRRAVDELGEVPSVLAYERLAAGRSDLPSAATVRNRLGRWSALSARLVAQRELARQTQARGQSVSGALARA